MTNENYDLLSGVRKSLDEIPVRTYNEMSLKMAVLQALEQILDSEVEEDAVSIAQRRGKNPER